MPITIFAIFLNVPRFYELEFDNTTRYFYNCRNNSETDNSTSSTDYDSFLILLSNIQKEVCTNYGVNVKGLRWNKIYQVVSLIWEIFIQIQQEVYRCPMKSFAVFPEISSKIFLENRHT